jgi:hypothetical protein
MWQLVHPFCWELRLLSKYVGFYDTLDHLNDHRISDQFSMAIPGGCPLIDLPMDSMLVSL